MHDVAEAQETASSELKMLPAALGVVCCDHEVPFQFSARVTVPPKSVVEKPTAAHADAVAQETPSRYAALTPLGATGADAAHEVPFQRSASGDVGPPPTTL